MSNPLFSEENQGSFMASISWLIAFFCVLLRDAADEARCAAALQSLLAERRKEITLLPTVSLGSAVFSGEDVVTVKDRADRALYCAKNELKARAAAAMPAGGSGEKD